MPELFVGDNLTIYWKRCGMKALSDLEEIRQAARLALETTHMDDLADLLLEIMNRAGSAIVDLKQGEAA